MAQLSAAGWRHFETLNSMFEKGQLKGQKAKPSEVLKKGKPVLKQWQLKPICSLSSQDQEFLLEKVTSFVQYSETLLPSTSGNEQVISMYRVMTHLSTCEGYQLQQLS